MKVLIFGVTGMLGNAMLNVFSKANKYEFYGTSRRGNVFQHFPPAITARIISDIDVENIDLLMRLFNEVRPQVVINCIGLVKQLDAASDPLQALPVNALLPHRLANICSLVGARLIHISSDCVYSGMKGNYCETDRSDALDLYGKSKYMGEVNYPHAITLRTSIIGHELNSAHGLVNWFLSQEGSVRGYTNAVFSGLPTNELARVIHDFVIPNPVLSGIYHVAAAPISKYDLLNLINQEYKKGLEIKSDDQLQIDRSLNAQRFQKATGYEAPSWPELISQMHVFQEEKNVQ